MVMIRGLASSNTLLRSLGRKRKHTCRIQPGLGENIGIDTIVLYQIGDEVAQLVNLRMFTMVAGQEGEQPGWKNVADNADKAGFGMGRFLLALHYSAVLHFDNSELTGPRPVTDVVDGHQGVLAAIGGDKPGQIEPKIIVARQYQEVLADVSLLDAESQRPQGALFVLFGPDVLDGDLHLSIHGLLPATKVGLEFPVGDKEDVDVRGDFLHDVGEQRLAFVLYQGLGRITRQRIESGAKTAGQNQTFHDYFPHRSLITALNSPGIGAEFISQFVAKFDRSSVWILPGRSRFDFYPR